MLGAFLQACADAAGTPTSMELWIRAAEVNRDLPRPDAARFAHRLAEEASPWRRL